MSKNLTKDQYWELFQKLPDELKNTILSEKTAKDVFDICERNEIDIEEISIVADYTGRVLFGILPPDEFQSALEEKVELTKDRAKKVAQEINRFIFYPVKASLEELYSMEIISSAQTKTTLPSSTEKGKSASKRKDTYREIVE